MRKKTFFSLCEFVLSYTLGIIIIKAVKCADTAQKIHLRSFSHQTLSSLHMRGTPVDKESQKMSSLISRLCSQSETDIPRRHHKPDPSPLHRHELKWEGKGRRKSHGATVGGRCSQDRWGKSTKFLLPAALLGPQESQVPTEPASERATGRTEGAASNPCNGTSSHKQKSADWVQKARKLLNNQTPERKKELDTINSYYSRICHELSWRKNDKENIEIIPAPLKYVYLE